MTGTPAGGALPAFAVLGLGEAGTAFAADLVAAGVTVLGHDPVATGPAGVRMLADPGQAAAAADLVLSVNSAAVAEQVAAAAMPAARAGTVWADLNTAPPAAKERLAALAEGHHLRFADVALLAPVPGRGLGTPALAAGTGAAAYAALVGPLGAQVEVLAAPAGAAAARKLIRSTVLKGFAAAILESLAAARAAGCEDWLRATLDEQLGAALVERLVTGSARHAARRVAEMDAAADLLGRLGVVPRVTEAARDVLAALAVEERRP